MNRTALIWGAGGGIGRALLTQLAAQDWTTIAVGRHVSELDGITPYVIEADVSDPRQVEHAVMAAAMETDSIDLWIYAVGDIQSAKVAEMDAAGWEQIMHANLTGAFLTTRYSLPLLAEDAYLVYLGAVSERLHLPGLSAYAAAKAGLEAFVDTLRKEERKRRIMIVRPRAVATTLWDKVPLRVPADAPPPEKVAARILEACDRNHKGVLDLAG